MNETNLHAALDSLDTGLPDRPDLGAVRAEGRRRARRRRLGIATGVGAVAAALVVPAVFLAGNAAHPGQHANHTFASNEDTAPSVTPSTPADQLAGPQFGVGMKDAVEQALPGSTLSSERLADGWTRAGQDSYDWTVQNPVQWATLFAWQQDFDLANGSRLDVVASRTNPDIYLAAPPYFNCDKANFPSRESCSAQDLGDVKVMVNDGVRFHSANGWNREIEIRYTDATRGLSAEVSLNAMVDAPTWADAQSQLPSVDELVALGRQQALVLPAPDHYPATPDEGRTPTTAP